ncbi:FG-GAP repeat domain-containing protein [Shewanella japonica]|uniref:FG-GAP repeat domain-containing protein n=1 Tax=Shewanella japonica TaxID=93973 RepID=UPI000E70D5B6|nr:VCBS repeat-containing protein [Shewanella japonica]
MNLINRTSLNTLLASCTGLLLAAHCQSIAAETSFTPQFTAHHIDADFELTQGIVSANILEHQGNELIAVGVDDNHERWLAIYGFENEALVQLDKLMLSKDIYSFDINELEPAKVSGSNQAEVLTQQLFFVTDNALLQYSPAQNTLLVSTTEPDEALDSVDVMPSQGSLKKVADIQSISVTTQADYISRGNFVIDINNDDIADILISDFRETAVLLGQANGGFIQQSLPLLPVVELKNNGAEYSHAKLYHSDMNFDQRDDIIKVGEGSLEVYYQQEDGQFSEIAEFISVSQPISGVDWWNKRDAYGENLDQSDLLYRKVERIGDVNGDGISDLVVRYTKSSGVLDRVNDYEIYLGINNNGKLTFPREANTTIKADGTLTGLRFEDLDNDEVDEVIVAGFDIGLSQIVSALLSGSIDQDVHVFKMNDASMFADKANVSKEVELSFSLTSGQSGEPVVALADINGDGFKELLLSDDNEELDIYYGQAGREPFKKRAEEWSVTIPVEGAMLSAVDINADGKDDLLLKFGRQDPENLQRRFSVLIAN